MESSCAAGDAAPSYWAHPCCVGAALALTAVASAALGSMATAFLLRRRRRDEDQGDYRHDDAYVIGESVRPPGTRRRRPRHRLSASERRRHTVAAEDELGVSQLTVLSHAPSLGLSTLSASQNFPYDCLPSSGFPRGLSGSINEGHQRVLDEDDEVEENKNNNNKRDALNSSERDEGDEVRSPEAAAGETTQRRQSRRSGPSTGPSPITDDANANDSNDNINSSNNSNDDAREAGEFRPASLAAPARGRASRRRATVSSCAQEASALGESLIQTFRVPLRAFRDSARDSVVSWGSCPEIRLGDDDDEDDCREGVDDGDQDDGDEGAGRKRHRRSRSDDLPADDLSASQRRQRRASLLQFRRREEPYISETELRFKGSVSFSSSFTSVSPSLPDSLHLLRRTRAVSSLSNRLMAAPDEATCIKEVTRLLVLMFGVERASFAMLTGSEHFLLQRVNAFRRTPPAGQEGQPVQPASQQLGDAQLLDELGDMEGREEGKDGEDPRAFDLEVLSSDHRRPLAGTAAGACVASLREHYTPRTADSPFDTHRVFCRNGFNTVLTSPILVNGNKCAGCIMLTKREEDGFRKAERVLVGDIWLLLGANIYAKRLLREAEESRRRSREMLHAFIPPKVLDKIECYWDANSDEFKSRNSANSSLSSGSVGSNERSLTRAESGASRAGGRDSEQNQKKGGERSLVTRTNSWFVAHNDWSDALNEAAPKAAPDSREVAKEKVRLIQDMHRLEQEENDSKVVIVSGTPGATGFSPTSHALYAESVGGVCIVFADIVGFSRIAMGIAPARVMDMLQDLFNRFDALCDVYGVLKLETIGDAYLCCTNLLEEEDDEGGVKDAAVRALGMAKDMVIEATNVQIPGGPKEDWPFGTLQIRVGIHVGDVTCGVLGQRLPKFTTCGTAVNTAARMEQTSRPGRIRVTRDFRDAVGDAEMGWSKMEVIPLKNMGSRETYLLDPLAGARMEEEERGKGGSRTEEERRTEGDFVHEGTASDAQAESMREKSGDRCDHRS